MIKWIKSFFSEDAHYIYGAIVNPDTGETHSKNKRRVNNRTGKLELLLWRAGEHGHNEDYWYQCGSGWIDWFVPNKDIGG